MSERLYVVVRADLPIGLQLAQVVHAALQFGRYVGERETVVVLHAPDEAALGAISDVLALVDANRDADVWKPLHWVMFQEPDLDMQLTAVAADGTAEVKRALRHLPLAFKSSRDSSGARAHTAGTCTPIGDATS